jgi:hypothetical protein
MAHEGQGTLEDNPDVGDHGKKKYSSDNDSYSEVSIDFLVMELEVTNACLKNQDHLLRDGARKYKGVKAELAEVKGQLDAAKFELACALCDLDLAKSAHVLTDESDECDNCIIVMTDLAELRGKHANMYDELEKARSELEKIRQELEVEKARPMLLAACSYCPALREELGKKDA